MISSRQKRVLALWLGLWIVLPALARAEIVVLDDGRFLKAEAYEVEGEKISIRLTRGGEVVMPLLRVDRVIDDEIAVGDETDEAVREIVPREPIYLGFAPESVSPDTPYGDIILSASERRNVNPRLVVAIVRAESAFDPMAVSHKGARGLMQLMPATGKSLGLDPEELFDAELNIEAGVTYLERLIERYADDLPLILAAYNAGETAVDRHHGVPPFRETRDYIRRIYAFLGLTVAPGAAPGK